MIIKYKVEKAFIDKNTKESVFVGDVVDVNIKRMKELNAAKIGRVIDIIEDKQEIENEKLSTDNEKEEVIAPDENDEKEPIAKIEREEEKYTEEQLEAMKVNELKDLAEKIGCELQNATKKEIIQEILEFQK